MTWKLNAWGKTRAGVTGVPWRDLSDEEYEGAAAQFEPGALEPYFEREVDAVVTSEPDLAGEDQEPQIASEAESPYFEPEAAAAAPEPEPTPAPRARNRRSTR